MPLVNPGESEKEYVSRCVPIVMKESNKTAEQAAGQCGGMYRQHRNATRKRGSRGK